MLNAPLVRPRGLVLGLLTVLFAVTLQSQAPPLRCQRRRCGSSGRIARFDGCKLGLSRRQFVAVQVLPRLQILRAETIGYGSRSLIRPSRRNEDDGRRGSNASSSRVVVTPIRPCEVDRQVGRSLARLAPLLRCAARLPRPRRRRCLPSPCRRSAPHGPVHLVAWPGALPGTLSTQHELRVLPLPGSLPRHTPAALARKRSQRRCLRFPGQSDRTESFGTRLAQDPVPQTCRCGNSSAISSPDASSELREAVRQGIVRHSPGSVNNSCPRSSGARSAGRLGTSAGTCTPIERVGAIRRSST